MDNKYVGELGTDVYGVTINEMRIGHISYASTQTVASDADGILALQALDKAGDVVTTFLKQPPYARNLTVVASADQTGKVVVEGLDIAGNLITEEFTLNGTTPIVGKLAFSKVLKVTLPVKVATETIDLGWGELIGLPFRLASSPLCWALDDGVAMTAPTFTVDATDLAENVVDFDGSLDGSVLDLFMVI